MPALPQPDLRIPSSTATVHVRVIDTTSRIGGIPTAPFFDPLIKGFDHLPNAPAYSFLVEHPSHPKRSLLFDLGVRKDWENLAAPVASRIKDNGWKVTSHKGVREQLEENSVKVEDIEGIIWSHWHWDHVGDPSTFEKNTALIVGPGFKEAFVPGFPANKDSPIRESDYEGRELREVSFENNGGLKIGNFNALDYYGDGSFYLLDSPGHAIGHLCALARVTSSPPSFIFMGGDACHHGGEFRPSQYLPFPDTVPSHVIRPQMTGTNIPPCPGSLFESLLRDGDPTKPFFAISRPDDGSGIAHDADEADRTIEKVIEADAQPDILVVMAHDHDLLGVLDFFPAYADDFVSKNWVEKGRWEFLKDFRLAIEDKLPVDA